MSQLFFVCLFVCLSVCLFVVVFGVAVWSFVLLCFCLCSTLVVFFVPPLDLPTYHSCPLDFWSQLRRCVVFWYDVVFVLVFAFVSTGIAVFIVTPSAHSTSGRSRVYLLCFGAAFVLFLLVFRPSSFAIDMAYTAHAGCYGTTYMVVVPFLTLQTAQ